MAGEWAVKELTRLLPPLEETHLARYPVIRDPPFVAGGRNETLMLERATAPTIRGALGRLPEVARAAILFDAIPATNTLAPRIAHKSDARLRRSREPIGLPSPAFRRRSD